MNDLLHALSGQAARGYGARRMPRERRQALARICLNPAGAEDVPLSGGWPQVSVRRHPFARLIREFPKDLLIR
jgi:hypothetical protein